MSGIKIIGGGNYLPDKAVPNDAFAAFLDTSDEWITTRTGIKERRVATGESVWELGYKAAKRAVKNAKIDKQEIDLIICTTTTSDFYFPAAASIIQNKLGVKNALSYDIAAACNGFPVALDIARKNLALGDASCVLVVSSERLSQVSDYTDRSSCVLFGDGAGAFIVKRDDEGLYSSHQNTNADACELIYAKLPFHTTPFAKSDANLSLPFQINKFSFLEMNGSEVYKYAVSAVPDAINTACQKAGINVDDIKMIIPHQANIRIIQTMSKKLGVPIEKFAVNIEKYGNTSSASIPICMNEYIESGHIKRGDIICITGFGAGFVYGAVIFRY